MDDQNISDQVNQSGQTSNSSQNQFSADEIIDKDILDLMGAQDMTPEKKDELYQKMVETIEIRVLARIDDQLSEEDVEKVKAAIDANDKDKFIQILRDKNINVEKVYAEEALIYKFEMVELMNNKTEE